MRMTLSAEDREILTIEKEIRRLNAIKNNFPAGNTEAEEKIHKKMLKLWSRQNSLIFDNKGNYRKDKRHLLSGCSLNISLIEEA